MSAYRAVPGIQPCVSPALPLTVHSADVRGREEFVEHIVSRRCAGECAAPAPAPAFQAGQGQFLDERDAEVVRSERTRQREEPCLSLTAPSAGRERPNSRLRPLVVTCFTGRAACDCTDVGRGNLRKARPELLRSLDRPQAPGTDREPMLDVQSRPGQPSQRVSQLTQPVGVGVQKSPTDPRADECQLAEQTRPQLHRRIPDSVRQLSNRCSRFRRCRSLASSAATERDDRSAGRSSAGCRNPAPDRFQTGRPEASSPGVSWLRLTLEPTRRGSSDFRVPVRHESTRRTSAKRSVRRHSSNAEVMSIDDHMGSKAHRPKSRASTASCASSRMRHRESRQGAIASRPGSAQHHAVGARRP